MLPHEIDSAVAQATGESICDIERLGFIQANPADFDFDPEPKDRPPLIIDWDARLSFDLP
jgi:hypothetical protein